MRLTHQTFQQQIPEFIREEYPSFVEFVRQYYLFLEKSDTYDIGDSLDIDTAPDEIIDKYYATYAQNLPTPQAFSKREFLRYCKEFYHAKGTVASFKFLFKAFFNATADVSLPGDNMLRLSDGKWQQLSSVDANVLFGDIPTHLFEGATLDFSNSNGIYLIDVVKITEISPGIKYRIFFKRPLNMTLYDGQIVDITNSVGVVIFRYQLVKGPVKLDVMVPGSNFQIGSIVSIPGTVKNTIARVNSLNGTGIGSLQVLEYGYDHVDGDISFNSPYANKPASNNYDLAAVYSSGHIIYTLVIRDFVDTLNETLAAGHQVQSGELYVSSDYVLDGYVAYIEGFYQQNVNTNQQNGIINSSLTYEQWLASRAMIRITDGMIAVHPGKYLDNKSLISEPSSVIQDSKIYQIYSYLISSDVDERDYKQALSIIHPAGLARFGEITKVNSFDTSTELQADYVNKFGIAHEDVQFIADALAKYYNKALTDSVTPSDSYAITTSKPMADSVSFVAEVAVPSTSTVIYESVSGSYFVDPTYNVSMWSVVIN